MTKEEAKKFGLQLLHGIMERNGSYPVYANNVKQAIDALSESGSSEIPNDLESYAQKVEDHYDVGEERGYLCVHRGEVKDAVIAGASWQKEQMMREAVEAIISQCPGSNEIIFHNPNSVHSWEFPWKFSAKGLNKGDKVRVIIVKED